MLFGGIPQFPVSPSFSWPTYSYGGALSPYATSFVPGWGYGSVAPASAYGLWNQGMAGAWGYSNPVTSAYGQMPTSYVASPAWGGAALLGLDPYASLLSDYAAAFGATPTPARTRSSVASAPADAVAAAYSAYSPRTHRPRRARRAAARSTRHAGEVWAGRRNPRSVHVTQVASRFNRNPAAGNRDCGPASVVMSLRLLGLRVPGSARGVPVQRLVNRIRNLAMAGPSSMATTNFDLERALARAGAATGEVYDIKAIRAAVLAGHPVILNGNPSNAGAYGHRFNDAQMTRYDGGHWIVVSGIDQRTGRFIINDPLSKVGAVKVSPAELERYRGGSLGIEVSAP